MKNIYLVQLPAPVEAVLREHLSRLQDAVVHTVAACPAGAAADLAITGESLSIAGCPVLVLNLAQPARLGDWLGEIGRMIAQPALYIGDIDLGGAIFSPQGKSVRNAAADVPLTDREVDILVYLARNRGTPVSRETLLKNVWQYQEGVDTHTLETHIYRLRQKIEDSAEAPQRLVTTEGGYALRLPEGGA